MSWFDICYFNGDFFGAVFCFDNGAGTVQYTQGNQTSNQWRNIFNSHIIIEAVKKQGRQLM